LDRADDPGARRRRRPAATSRSAGGLTGVYGPGVGAWDSQVVVLPPREAANGQLVVGDIPRGVPGFQPRPGLMAQLDLVGSGVHVLTGLPGAGSTQLAAAYARAKLAAGWRVVAWINARDTGNLEAGLAAVADAAGLSDAGSGWDAADAGQAVRRWLETDGEGCLLVFDDVEDPEVLRPFVPAGDVQVLITGLRQPPANLGASVPLGAFNDDEALAFLTRRTGLADAEGAAAVIAELGHLPLTLTQAAVVIGGQRLRYDTYLDRLRVRPGPENPAPAEEASQTAIARALLLSLQAVRTADRTGVCTAVMEIMAVLSAGGVHRELLHVAGEAGLLASGGQRIPAAMVDRAVGWLSHRSLLTLSLDGRTVTTHRLVAQAVRDGLTRQQRQGVCWTAASGLEAYAGTLVGSHDRPALRAIPQHVAALLDNTAGLAGANTELAENLLRLRFIALYDVLELGDSNMQAIEAGESLTADLEQLLGPDHPGTLNARNSLAAAYLAAGQAAAAIPLFEQTLAVRQHELGPDDPDTLTSQNNLAAAYQDAGQPAEAVRLYELNLAARERLLGPDHPSTLNSRANLATAYRDAGRAAEAVPLFEQALAGRERILGHNHPDTQTSRANLAAAYRDAGRDGEAARTLGPGQSDPRTSRKNLPYRAAKGIPPVERSLASAARPSPGGAAGRATPAGFRRPPADPARRVLPAAFRRPPAHPARSAHLDGVARSSARRAPRTSGPPPVDTEYDHRIAAAITAGDPAGIAMAYDRYAAALYGYCHSMLHDPVGAAQATRDTFVVAAATLINLPEAPELRPWLYARARAEGQRLHRPSAHARGREAEPEGLTGLHGEPVQAQLRSLIDTILGTLTPREREVIELSVRHGLSDSELAVVLGVSDSRAQALVTRARGELEEALRALRLALTGREACPVLGQLLADWDGRLTEQTRDVVSGHVEQCQTCAHPGWSDALSPAALAGLMPLAPLPPALREEVLGCCSATTEDAAAYRRRVARRADSKWAAGFSHAIRRVSWDNIKANPGMAVAAMVVVLWVVTAVSITLFTFAGSHPAVAGAARPVVRTSVSDPPATATAAPASPVASAPTTARQPLAYQPSPVRPSTSPPSLAPSEPASSPSPKPSGSASGTPSKSPSASASASPSKSPSPSSSASASTSATPSPSATP
jgi:RNA polymerase sigma factor (sigma-70 family)